MLPLVTIIIPLHNSDQFIAATIQSVLEQSYRNWEMIIIDDCSKDNSVEIVESFAKKDNRINLIRLKKNSGAAIARNIGIEEARGDYIAFLDSDDTWLPEKLEKQLQEMQRMQCSFSHTSYSLYDENNQSLNLIIQCNQFISYKDLVKYNWIGTSTVIYDVNKLGKHYMPNLRNRQDWALWLKLIKGSETALFIKEPLTKYTVRANSISSNKIKLIRFHWLIYRQVEKFSVFSSFIYLIKNLYNHFKKSKFIKHT